MTQVCRKGFVLVMFCAMTAGAFMLMPKKASARHCAAIIYEDADYRGEHQCLQVGQYNLSDLGIRNDSLSSIKVSKSNTVVLFEHKNFGGRRYIIHHNHSYIGDGWNDKVSSILVE